MRTDCEIDRRSVRCPNTSLLGYNKGIATIGDLIVFKEHYADGSFGHRTGRMIGRVSAPKLPHDTKEVNGWLLVLALSDDFSFAMERWVEPEDVTQVRAVPSRMLEFFARPVLPAADVLRRAGEYGSLTDHYIADPKSKYSKELGYPRPKVQKP